MCGVSKVLGVDPTQTRRQLQAPTHARAHKHHARGWRGAGRHIHNRTHVYTYRHKYMCTPNQGRDAPCRRMAGSRIRNVDTLGWLSSQVLLIHWMAWSEAQMTCTGMSARRASTCSFCGWTGRVSLVDGLCEPPSGGGLCAVVGVGGLGGGGARTHASTNTPYCTHTNVYTSIYTRACVRVWSCTDLQLPQEHGGGAFHPAAGRGGDAEDVGNLDCFVWGFGSWLTVGNAYECMRGGLWWVSRWWGGCV